MASLLEGGDILEGGEHVGRDQPRELSITPVKAVSIHAVDHGATTASVAPAKLDLRRLGEREVVCRAHGGSESHTAPGDPAAAVCISDRRAIFDGKWERGRRWGEGLLGIIHGHTRSTPVGRGDGARGDMLGRRGNRVYRDVVSVLVVGSVVGSGRVGANGMAAVVALAVGMVLGEVLSVGVAVGRLETSHPL